jgi:hypothetical protein
MGLDPITIAGLVTALAGAGVSEYGAQQSASAMNNATANEVAQQEALQKKATPVYNANQQNFTPQKAQQTLSQGSAQALQQYQTLANASISTQPLSIAPKSGVVQARTGADIARQQQAGAALQGYPALQSSWAVGDTNTNAQLGNIGAIGSSLASSFPYQLAQAGQTGATAQGIGSLLGSLGMLGGVYGATQAKPSYNLTNASIQSGLDNGNPYASGTLNF